MTGREDSNKQLRFLVVDSVGRVADRMEDFFRSFVDKHLVYRADDKKQVIRIGKQKDIDILVINAEGTGADITEEDCKEYKKQIKETLRICVVVTSPSALPRSLEGGCDHLFMEDELSFFKLCQVGVEAQNADLYSEKDDEFTIRRRKMQVMLDQLKALKKGVKTKGDHETDKGS